ncbi:MAG: hypothetical protein CSA18_02515 [Deltaproteobacteria bacterium]|nr:MAG: hypothetical protein CSB21_00950 [Deltaproteobacteria bacterium]PIE75001.1 MAG: hypothetical protein CSA18_02515 [Deltaproteobacteria bacterium]
MVKEFFKNKIVICFAVIMFLYSFTGFLVIPFSAGLILPGKLEKMLERKVVIEKIRFNPFVFSASIENMKVFSKSGKDIFAGFENLYLNVDASASLFNLGAFVDEITIKSPVFNIERKKDGRFNFSDLTEKKSGDEKTETKDGSEKKKFKFSLKDILIENGKLTFKDLPHSTNHISRDLKLQIPLVSGLEETSNSFMNALLSFILNDAKVEADIKLKPFIETLESELDLKIGGFKIKKYKNYIAEYVDIVPEKGNISLYLKAFFEKKSKLKMSAEVSFNDIFLKDSENKSLAGVKKLVVKSDNIFPLQNKYKIKKISGDSFFLNIIREKNKINILNLYKKNNSESLAKQDIPKDKKKSLPLEFILGELDFTNSEINFTDHDAPLVKAGYFEKAAETSLSGMNINIKSFSLDSEEKSNFSFKAFLNKDTRLGFKGKFSLSPVFAGINGNIDDFDFKYINSYIPEKVNLLMNKGSFDLGFDTEIKKEKDDFLINLEANFLLKDFNIVERDKKEDFFSMQKLEFSGLNFNLKPMTLDIKKIFVSGVDQKIVINNKGILNLVSVFGEIGEKTPEKKEKNEIFPVNISEIKIIDSGAGFTDFSITPHFNSNIFINSMDILNFSTSKESLADFALDGSINKNSSLKAKGQVKPFLKDIFADIKLKLEDLNLGQLTPYSGKFIGRAIKQGQLNLDLDYKIKNKKLKSKNILLVDQLELGRKIKSKSAVNLPLGLAVSLLKDRKGQIKLDLPVSGNLNDPKFKLGKVIFQVFKNIIIKAASSPFSLLASIVGSKEDLKYIEFKYGGLELKDGSLKKIKDIRKVLFERPALKLYITGFSDIEKDRAEIQSEKYEKLLASSKESYKNSVHKEALLGKIYFDIFKKEPVLLPEADPVVYLEKEIKSSFIVTDEDLRLLCGRRGEKIKNMILEDKTIKSSRVFLNDTEKISGSLKKGISSSRIELDVK